MKKKLCPCGEKSIPGLISSISLCQKHYNYVMFETDKHKHNEGVRMMEYYQQVKQLKD